jgi:hypothetical protein
LALPEVSPRLAHKLLSSDPQGGFHGRYSADDPQRHLVGLVTSTDLLLLLIDLESARALPYDFRLEEVRSLQCTA